MRTTRKISIVVVALVVMTVGLALPAQAGTEGAFLSKINASRAAAGLAPVSVHSDLVPDARAHSAEMMAAGNIYHTSPLSAVASGWEALAENVGAGPSVDSLHAAFMASSGHRRNILGDYNYVGIGVSQSDSGQLWVTVIFMRKGAPAPAPTTTTTTTTAPPPPTTVAPAPIPDPAPAPTPAPAPAPTTTTTTAAPKPQATTTTVAPAPATQAVKANAATPTPTPEPAPEEPIVRIGRALHLPIID
ncbi:MAG: CAP domain-containing protein [Actinomycetota bacterium]|nr:CAP domain-containing protein [Actinomycetota bacterium]